MGISVWAGYTVGLGLWTLIPAILGVIFFTRSAAPLHRVEKIPLFILLSIGLAFLLIFIFIQNGFDVSADTAIPFAAEHIRQFIPHTYLPEFNVPFVYPAGVPSIVSQIAGVGIPFHVVAWGIGLVGLLLFLHGLVRLAGNYFSSVSVAVAAGILLLGLRLPFQSFLSGEYALLLGLGLVIHFIIPRQNPHSLLGW
ncbi:MAG: hypothetical protein AABY11_00485, partial [archaeon]